MLLEGVSENAASLLIRLHMARRTGELLQMLPWPALSANCVGWNPRNLRMLVFASNDRTIPVRCSNSINFKRKQTHENWVVCCSDGRT